MFVYSRIHGCTWQQLNKKTPNKYKIKYNKIPNKYILFSNRVNSNRRYAIMTTFEIDEHMFRQYYSIRHTQKEKYRPNCGIAFLK